MKRYKKYLKLLALFVFGISIILLQSCNSTQDKNTKIKKLSVEYLSNPLGVDVAQPRFSWQLWSSQRDVYQVAYQLVVGESIDEVKNGNGTFWDSGKTTSEETVNLEYEGSKLQSNTTYFWRVQVWLDDETSIWSEPAFFQTGIFNENEWQAKWITTQEKITNASPLLRKGFQIEKKIKQAIAHVTAAGFYEFFLNGEKVGDHVLDPGVTDYRETVLYSTYDVTTLLKEGGNVTGAMLGNGAWNLLKTEGRYSWGRGNPLGSPAFFMQLVISYEDGSEEVIVSDETWKTADSPITFNNLYGGEDYDATKELPGWSSSGFDDSGWATVALSQGPGGKLKAQLTPPIKVTQTLSAVKQTNPQPGVYLFDLGQNIAGWWRLEIEGEPGQVIRIRGAETLNDSLFSTPLQEGDKLSTKERYHAQTWTDYTIKSNKRETYEPRFFYTGFRYIEVTVNDQRNPKYLNIEGRVVRSANERNGTFKSSNTLLNRIYEAGVWAQMSNMQSYPTDCPHREKGAYNGDGQVIAETSMHDFHMAPFYTKWLNDMRDSQEENGRIPNTSPVLVGGMGGGVAWGSAYVLIPWWMNHYYQDTQILKEHYPTMKKYVNYLRELGSKDENPSEPYIIDNFDGYWYSLGEWCAPGESDCPNHPVVNTFYYYQNCLLLSKIAGKLGHAKDQEYYKALSDTVKKEFNRKFFNTETGLYGTDSTYQTYQLLALAGDVVPEDYREKVFQTIIDDIKTRSNHLNTGIIGTKYLWPVLVENGENETAYKIATQTTYPSFGYWINNGATTLLESWEGDNSHNHQMFGSVTEYFYKFLAGIQSPMEGKTANGYRNIYVKPFIPNELEAANASVETVAGAVVSEWKKENGNFIQNVTIPANTTATVSLPVSPDAGTVLWEGDSKIWVNNQYIEGTTGIYNVVKNKNHLDIEIGSGIYQFKVETKE
ncbi:family 78 glycoside hydrolase catalytic domain [Maribellus maritimus]|uniref:family 78 glycoside hydrolase catalytic domain n=1 Tax=Maribellus maritimus TaxID=2870838 RepID=UPI001EECDAB8|nr:family 78 glycoside hydrolase catalytic domain [Maribellus maritimus]MCG6187336.1 glycoside hydrolase family 78 protein [Maribellus maritimus]